MAVLGSRLSVRLLEALLGAQKLATETTCGSREVDLALPHGRQHPRLVGPS